MEKFLFKSIRSFSIFAIAGIIAIILSSCGDDGSGGGSGNRLTVYADGEVVNSLELFSNQTVALEAELKDAGGNIVSNPVTSWSVNPVQMGTFSDPTDNITDFTVFNGAMTGTGYGISVECDGIKKKIPVKVDMLEVTFSFPGGNSVVNTGAKQITVTVKRGGVEATDVPITWSTSNGAYPGIFTPSTAYSGQVVTYQPNIPSGMTGSLYVSVTVYGVTRSILFNITD